MFVAFRFYLIGIFFLILPILVLANKPDPALLEEAHDTLMAAEAEVKQATKALQDFRATPMPVIEAQKQLYEVTLAAKQDILLRAEANYKQALAEYNQLSEQTPDKHAP